MEYEIDFLPVGDGEKSGDAICLRYSYDGGESWHVGVIDGGTQNNRGQTPINFVYGFEGVSP